MDLVQLPNVISSTVASSLRGWRGLMQRTPREVEPQLELYEFEACPYCRLVRETITELQLDVLVYPCPRGGRYRDQARELAGGKTTYPFLVDLTREERMAESADIIAYLWKHYGEGNPPWRSPLALPTSSLASLVRFYRGALARDAREPEQPLTLYSFEASPFCRIVRERLCELQIPYHLVSMAKEQVSDFGMGGKTIGGKDYVPVPGGRREHLREVGGKSQVPYLIDPNTGVSMYESKDIVAYLDETYAQ